MEKDIRFLCNCSWQNTLKKLPDASRLKVYDAMFEYAHTGKVEGLSLIEEVSFDFIKSEIDRYIGNYKNRCEKNKENIKKRWEEWEGKEGKGIQSYTMEGNPNPNPNPNHNHNPNLNPNPNSNRIPEKVQEVKYSSDEHTTSCDESDYSKFCRWIKERAPYLYKNCEHIITEKELIKLLRSYTVAEICDTIISIENRRDKRQTYTNLYLTTFNWLKREYGKPSERPILR